MRVAIATLKDQLMKGILDPEIEIQALCQDLKAELKKNCSYESLKAQIVQSVPYLID
ncbi:MAG TPA: hypothetical protein VLF61_02930 [Rhabdochlamydiaceae bacterium]|nr:hypothetical protein [Rhabdochlamydiaceae bacterium]